MCTFRFAVQFFLSLLVTVFFDPTTYTVTEGEGVVADLMLVRSGGLARTVVVSVNIVSGTAVGMTQHCLLQYCVYNTQTRKSIPLYSKCFCSQFCVVVIQILSITINTVT